MIYDVVMMLLLMMMKKKDVTCDLDAFSTIDLPVNYCFVFFFSEAVKINMQQTTGCNLYK